MAEAAAAIGLVASIITLIDCGAKIVSRIEDFTAQTANVPQTFRSLADRLPLLSRTLQRVQKRAQAGDVADDVARDLKVLVDSINVQIEILERCLDRIALPAVASRTKKIITALQSLTKDEQVTRAVEKIHGGIDVLVLHQITTNVDLSDQVLQLIKDLAGLNLDQAAPLYAFGLWLDRAPQIPPDAFFGRAAELQQLDDWLSPGDDVMSQKVVSITGMGGLGKTQLSLAYARRHGGQYSSVFWLNAQDKFSLQQGILTLGRSIFPNDEADAIDSRDEERRIQRVRRWLSEPGNDRWLIIFDNYDNPALPNVRSPTGFDLREFFPSRAQGSILITTRSQRMSFSRRLVLQKLDQAATQIAILSQRAGRDLSHETDAQSLASRLDGLPLALASAGTYLGQTGESCANYLVTYNELWDELHGPESEALLEYADRKLFSTWTISLDQVRQQDTDAVEILKFFALFNNEDIWYELLQVGAPYGPAWMDRVTATKIRFDRAIIKLRDYSLLEVTPSSYRVHPCVHDWLLGQFHLVADKSWFLAALKCITGSIIDETDPHYWKVSRRLVQHIQRLEQRQFRNLWQTYSFEEIAIDASHNFGRIYQELGRLNEAEQMYLRALAGKEKVFGAEHTLTLKTVNNLGLLYANQGKLAEAEQMYLRALAGKERALGPEHTLTLDTVHNLGLLYTKQDKLVKAEQMYLRALTGTEKALGAEHTSTLDTINNLGVLYKNQGKLAEAEQMYTRALAGHEKALGAEHTSTLNIVHNLGVLYSRQGKRTKAEQMYTRALGGREKALGAEHISTLDTINNLGVLYRDQGNLAEAEQMYLRALAGTEKALGAEHFSTLDTVHNLGVLHSDRGKPAEAEQMYLRALAGKEKALGAEHTSTLNTVNNLGILYREQGKLAEAEQMYLRALAGYEKALGAEHTSTLDTINNLGVLYKNQGKLAEAEQMYTRALAGHEKALGAEHTSTLNTVNNLGVLYHDQGKLVEAEHMHLRALASKEKVLGAEHTSTLNTINNLGVLYRDQGKLAEAEQMYTRALAGKEKALGAEHTSTLDTIDNLGILYSTQGKLTEAERMFSRVLAGKEKVLGLEHTSTLNTVNNLGLLYANQGKLAEAEQMYLRALAGKERALGPEHTSALDTINNLGVLYRKQSKLVEAEQMYVRALAGYEKALGPEHTSTLDTVRNLGILYRHQGKLVEAERMFSRAAGQV